MLSDHLNTRGIWLSVNVYFFYVFLSLLSCQRSIRKGIRTAPHFIMHTVIG